MVEGKYLTAKLRSSGWRYNCSGLVLAFRRTSIADMTSVQGWLREDGYRPLMQGSPPWPGDVVIYRDESGRVDHLGIVLEAATDPIGAAAGPLVVSKWGFLPEYTHRVMDTPFGSSVEYWTERV